VQKRIQESHTFIEKCYQLDAAGASTNPTPESTCLHYGTLSRRRPIHHGYLAERLAQERQDAGTLLRSAKAACSCMLIHVIEQLHAVGQGVFRFRNGAELSWEGQQAQCAAVLQAQELVVKAGNG